MATVTVRYRCPVTPDECPSSPRRGFCQNHEWERLVPERVYLTAGTDDGAGAGGDTGTGTATPGDGAPRAGTTAPGGAAAGTGKATPGNADAGVRRPGRAGAGSPAPEPGARGGRAAPRPAGSDGDPGRTGRRRTGGGRQGGDAHADPAQARPPSARPSGGHATPTRVQAPPAATPPPGRGAPRPGPVPAPAAPQLALVLAGALIPVRGPEQGSTELGRDAPDCAHVPGLADLDQLSRRHAELTWHAGMLYVTDVGSSNGTYVDGVRVTRPVQLWPGRHRLQLAQKPESVDVDLVELDEYGAPR
ncbi:FHA domain-containing protein [Streptomyces sp. JNUCC 63]